MVCLSTLFRSRLILFQKLRKLASIFSLAWVNSLAVALLRIRFRVFKLIRISNVMNRAKIVSDAKVLTTELPGNPCMLKRLEEKLRGKNMMVTYVNRRTSSEL